MTGGWIRGATDGLLKQAAQKVSPVVVLVCTPYSCYWGSGPTQDACAAADSARSFSGLPSAMYGEYGVGCTPYAPVGPERTWSTTGSLPVLEYGVDVVRKGKGATLTWDLGPTGY